MKQPAFMRRALPLLLTCSIAMTLAVPVSALFGRTDKEPTAPTVAAFSKNGLSTAPITFSADDFVVNGKAELDWVMERQAVRTDKASGIVNDANDWAIETMGNPRYPLELFQRVVTVSLETQKIIASLPPLDIREDG